MKITMGHQVFDVININGEDYIKVKDINRIVATHYRDKVCKGMEDAFENFWGFITSIERDTIDFDQETQKFEKY